MRTTVELPDDLVIEIKSISGAKTLKESIIRSFEAYICNYKLQKLRELGGKMQLNIDLDIARHGRKY